MLVLVQFINLIRKMSTAESQFKRKLKKREQSRLRDLKRKEEGKLIILIALFTQISSETLTLTFLQVLKKMLFNLGVTKQRLQNVSCRAFYELIDMF